MNAFRDRSRVSWPRTTFHHVVDMAWPSKRNGELLELMVKEPFEAPLTVDRNIEHQLNIRKHPSTTIYTNVLNGEGLR